MIDVLATEDEEQIDVEALEEKIDDLNERHRQASQAAADANAREPELERKAEEAEAEAEALEREAASTALIEDPAGNEEAAAKREQAEQLRAEIAEAREEAEEARNRKAAIIEERDDLATEQIPRGIEAHQGAVKDYRAGLAALGRDVLDRAAEVEDAREQMVEIRQLIKRLKSLVHGDGDRGLRDRQLREVRRALREHEADLFLEEVAGLLVRDVVNWIRHSDRFDDELEERGIEPLEGSIRRATPVPAHRDLAHKIETDKHVPL